jgi:hypothetical protein
MLQSTSSSFPTLQQVSGPTSFDRSREALLQAAQRSGGKPFSFPVWQLGADEQSDRLLNEARTAGWSSHYRSDSIDGDTFEFAPTNPVQ